MKFKQKVLTVSVIAAMTTLAGCGGGSDGDSTVSGSSETVQGRITGFGSIYVAGVEYETDNAMITVDGKPASEDDLELGMMVTVKGNSSGAYGHAQRVDFDDDVEGVITEVNLDQNGMGTMTIMGHTVTVDANTMVEIKARNIDSMMQAVYDPNMGIQYVAEVSGYSDGNGNIHATRIEVKAYDDIDGEIEVKGFVKNHDGVAMMFMIGNMEVVYSDATRYDDMSHDMLADGMHVEVKGHGFDTQGRLIADEIENENDSGVNSGDDEDEYEIEGVVTSITDDSFQINGQTIYYNQNTRGMNALAENALVEVEAYRDGQSRLVAHEIEIDGLDDSHDHSGIEMKGMLQAIDLDNNTIQMMGKTIHIDASTMMQDDHSHIRYFSLQDIDLTMGDHYVEVKAYVDENGNLVASKLCYEGTSYTDMDELEGPLTVDETGSYMMGIAIDFGNFATPMHGARAEMKGSFSGGMFYVSMLEIDSSDDSDSDS
jgi:hypothetical protein